MSKAKRIANLESQIDTIKKNLRSIDEERVRVTGQWYKFAMGLLDFLGIKVSEVKEVESYWGEDKIVTSFKFSKAKKTK